MVTSPRVRGPALDTDLLWSAREHPSVNTCADSVLSTKHSSRLPDFAEFYEPILPPKQVD